jgi:hypothetical protein
MVHIRKTAIAARNITDAVATVVENLKETGV